MTTLTTPSTNFHHAKITTPSHHHHHRQMSIQSTHSGEEKNKQPRRKFMTTLLATSVVVGGLNNVTTPSAQAENWGTRSFILERYFQPGLSPEDAVARIRQTAQGLHSIRNMLETLSWRYVLFYIRLKAAYLSQDMKNALNIVPQNMKSSYVKTANELVDNMSKFDSFVRSPKIYESYLYYEKTLKSIDELVALLA